MNEFPERRWPEDSHRAQVVRMEGVQKLDGRHQGKHPLLPADEPDLEFARGRPDGLDDPHPPAAGVVDGRAGHEPPQRPKPPHGLGKRGAAPDPRQIHPASEHRLGRIGALQRPLDERPHRRLVPPVGKDGLGDPEEFGRGPLLVERFRE